MKVRFIKRVNGWFYVMRNWKIFPIDIRDLEENSRIAFVIINGEYC